MQRKDFPGEQFFVVFVIKPEDYACGGSVPSSIHGKLYWEADLVAGGGAAGVLGDLPVGWHKDDHMVMSYPGSCEEDWSPSRCFILS